MKGVGSRLDSQPVSFVTNSLEISKIIFFDAMHELTLVSPQIDI